MEIKKIIGNRMLSFCGVGALVLSMLTSTSNQEGTPFMPIAIILLSQVALLVFIVMAIVRLWQEAKIVSVILASSSVLLIGLSFIPDLTSLPSGNPFLILFNIGKLINFVSVLYSVWLLWKIGQYEKAVNAAIRDSGLTPTEFYSVYKDLLKGEKESGEQRIDAAQESHHEKFTESTGIDIQDVIPIIGHDISWVEIVNHVFRVIEFDRDGTRIDNNDQVTATSMLKPYGYLVVESPVSGQKAKMPIIHRDDFLLASSVFDIPKFADFVVREELLVTYSPKILLPGGFSGSPDHVLHYLITRSGTLNSYYQMDNYKHIGKPNPGLLFSPFTYQGEIKVQLNWRPF